MDPKTSPLDELAIFNSLLDQLLKVSSADLANALRETKCGKVHATGEVPANAGKLPSE